MENVVFSFPPTRILPFPCSFPFPWNWSISSHSQGIPMGSMGTHDIDSSLLCDWFGSKSPATLLGIAVYTNFSRTKLINLRPRRHSVKPDCNNFINRLHFKNTYQFSLLIYCRGCILSTVFTDPTTFQAMWIIIRHSGVMQLCMRIIGNLHNWTQCTKSSNLHIIRLFHKRSLASHHKSHSVTTSADMQRSFSKYSQLLTPQHARMTPETLHVHELLHRNLQVEICNLVILQS